MSAGTREKRQIQKGQVYVCIHKVSSANFAVDAIEQTTTTEAVAAAFG